MIEMYLKIFMIKTLFFIKIKPHFYIPESEVDTHNCLLPGDYNKEKITFKMANLLNFIIIINQKTKIILSKLFY